MTRFISAFVVLALIAGASISVAQGLPTSGLVVHLSADGPLSLNGSDDVLEWTDQSGNLNHAIPGISPRWVANSVNGLPAINFSGPLEHLNLPNTTSSLGISNSDYEMFVVGRSNNSNVQFATAGATGAGVAKFELHLNGGNGARFIPRPGSDYADLGVDQQFADGDAHIFNTRVDGNVGFLRIDGMENGDTVAAAQTSLNERLTLGVRGNASLPWIGDQAEVLIYDRALSSSERRRVEQYLASKWDAPINVASATQGATPFANEVFAGGTNASHQIDHLNNGLYGNSESWLGNNTGADTAYAGVAFDGQYDISSLAFGRDATGSFSDRDLGTYEFQYTRDEFDPNDLSSINAANWLDFLTVTYPGDAPTGFEHLRSEFDFDTIGGVTGVRALLSDNSIAIDELEVFGTATVPEPASLVLWGLMGVIGIGCSAQRLRRQR